MIHAAGGGCCRGCGIGPRGLGDARRVALHQLRPGPLGRARLDAPRPLLRAHRRRLVAQLLCVRGSACVCLCACMRACARASCLHAAAATDSAAERAAQAAETRRQPTPAARTTALRVAGRRGAGGDVDLQEEAEVLARLLRARDPDRHRHVACTLPHPTPQGHTQGLRHSARRDQGHKGRDR